MICYMPYTVLVEQQFEILADTPDALTVYSPAHAIVPNRMRLWAEQGKLDIRHPQGVDGDQLIGAMGNYKTWADLHQGSINDMAGFFQTQQGRIPMMDDTNPSQIGHQIRHYGEPPTGPSVDPLFKAALFLSMAQEYDEQQHGMARQMDIVHAKEQEMFKQLCGGIPDAEAGMPLTPKSFPTNEDRMADDPHMIVQRVQAWATLALGDHQPPLLYLTLNQAVVDHLLDLFPQAKALSEQNLDFTGIQADIRSLAFESNPEAIDMQTNTNGSVPESRDRIALFCLTGISPVEFLFRLAGQGSVDMLATAEKTAPINTFFGGVTRG